MAEAASDRVDVPFYRDDQNSDEETLHRIFNDISQVLQMEEFDDDLKASLEKIYPTYLKTLEERADDLMKKDCAIVITGETSAGKSSIINLLLKTDILPEGNMVTTTAICKIKYSDQKKILVYDRNGKLIRTVIPSERGGSMEQRKENFTRFGGNQVVDSDFVEYEDVMEEEEEEEEEDEEEEEESNDTYTILKRNFQYEPSDEIHTVEVCHPINILKGNIMIVDTPGVGDNDELNDILKEYLPYAVAFVFIVDPTRGGGMQDDRILKVMKSINESRDTMKCFKESDVIFAVNKWDAVYTRRRSETPWSDIVEKIKKAWPHVNPDNIIKMSARQVHTGKGEPALRENFKTFERVLHALIEKNVNIRIIEHQRFVSSILSKVASFVKLRHEAMKIEFSGLCKEIAIANNRLSDLEKENVARRTLCEKHLEEALKEHGCKLIAYVHSGKFENLVLTSKPDLLTMNRMKIGYAINKRIEENITNWIDQNHESIRKEVEDVISRALDDIIQDLRGALQRFGCTTQDFEIGYILKHVHWRNFLFGLIVFSALMATGSIVLSVVGGAFTTACVLGKTVSDAVRLTKQEIISTSFQSRVKVITQETILKMLDEKYVQPYQKLLEELFTKQIPMEIENAKKMVNSLLTDRKAYMDKFLALSKLSREFDEIKNTFEGLNEV